MDSRQITFINQCDQTVWLAAVTNTRSGGWQMPATSPCSTDSDCADGMTCNTDTSLCELVLDFELDGVLSGRFWPRTDCSFQDDGLCASVNGAKSNCCATGGCVANDSGDFGLNCIASGIAPTTVAEFTMQPGTENDFYDISIIDGYNVPVVMQPDSMPDCPSGFGDCNYWCGNPGGRIPTTPGLGQFGCRWEGVFGTDCAGLPRWSVVAPQVVNDSSDCQTPAQFRSTPIGDVCTCGTDSDGNPLNTDCATDQVCGFGNNQIIGTRVCGSQAGCTTGKALCGIEAYFLGSGGESCEQDSDCATGQCQNGVCSPSPADFLSCGETDTTAAPCTDDQDCPSLIGFQCESDNDCPPPTSCVSLGASGDPKNCRQPCVNDFCVGATCQSDDDCLIFNDKPTGTFSRCADGQCVPTITSILEASGLNGQSCYIHYYPSQTAPSIACGGCPTSSNNPLRGPWPPTTEECLNSNPAWTTLVQIQLVPPKIACPTAYTFPFDDPTSTFQCSSGTENSQSYTVVFCEPQSDG